MNISSSQMTQMIALTLLSPCPLCLLCVDCWKCESMMATTKPNIEIAQSALLSIAKAETDRCLSFFCSLLPLACGTSLSLRNLPFIFTAHYPKGRSHIEHVVGICFNFMEIGCIELIHTYIKKTYKITHALGEATKAPHCTISEYANIHIVHIYQYSSNKSYTSHFTKSLSCFSDGQHQHNTHTHKQRFLVFGVYFVSSRVWC